MKSEKIIKNKNIEELAADCNHRILAIWAADCVEHVIKYYSVYFPRDGRIENAIMAARGFAKGQVAMLEARRVALEAHKAAKEVEENKVAKSVAKAAGHAAATAHVRINAIYAASYAVKAKAHSSEFDTSVIKKEQDWQCQRLRKIREKFHQN